MKFKSKKNGDTEEEEETDFHHLPAGEFPRNGPRSSMVSIVIFYVSKVITLVGFLMVARAVFFEEVNNLPNY